MYNPTTSPKPDQVDAAAFLFILSALIAASYLQAYVSSVKFSFKRCPLPPLPPQPPNKPTPVTEPLLVWDQQITQ